MPLYGEKKSYNKYRKRDYYLTNTQKRIYANEMKELEDFLQKSNYNYSSTLDSCYLNLPEYELRLSNNNPTTKYHDLNDREHLLVNVKCSKLNFPNMIKFTVPKIIKRLKELDLNSYRYIHIISETNLIHCYHHGYKTKRSTFNLF